MLKRFCVIVIGSLLADVTSSWADSGSTIISGQSMPIQITLPASWVKLKPQAGQQILAANRANHELVLVEATNRSDIDDETLTQFAKDRIAAVAHKVDGTVSEPTTTTVNGSDAVRYELHGIIHGSQTPIGYIVTILQSKSYFAFVIAGAPEPDFKADADELCALAGGFAEKPQ